MDCYNVTCSRSNRNDFSGDYKQFISNHFFQNWIGMFRTVFGSVDNHAFLDEEHIIFTIEVDI